MIGRKYGEGEVNHDVEDIQPVDSCQVEALPCPKCKGKHITIAVRGIGLYYCKCLSCGKLGSPAKTQDLCVERWNKIKRVG